MHATHIYTVVVHALSFSKGEYLLVIANQQLEKPHSCKYYESQKDGIRDGCMSVCLSLYMYACSQTWCIYLMWLSLNYVPLLYFSRFYRASNEKLLNSLHSLSVFVCSSPRAKNFKHKTNQWTEWGEVAEKDTAKSNILRHKDGTKNEYVMFVSYKYQQCSDVYLWVASLVLYRYIFQANNVMKKKNKNKQPVE